MVVSKAYDRTDSDLMKENVILAWVVCVSINIDLETSFQKNMGFEWNKLEWLEVLERKQGWFWKNFGTMNVGLKMEHEHK